MRVIAASIVALSVLSAPAAMACDFHGGGFDPYMDTMADDQWLAVRARLAEYEREQAMEAARVNFLSRFKVEADAPVEEPQVVAQLDQSSVDDADRRTRSDTQDR